MQSAVLHNPKDGDRYQKKYSCENRYDNVNEGVKPFMREEVDVLVARSYTLFLRTKDILKGH